MGTAPPTHGMPVGVRWPRVAAAAAALLLALAGVARADFEGKVVVVKDGDSIEVLRRGKAVEVRLFGIDCPEKGQAFGDRAKHATSDLAYGRVVGVAERGTDRYGRTLADVTLPDGRVLNRELVREGLAWWYRRYSDDRTLEALEAEARAARRGLWADREPRAPWDFRAARSHRGEGRGGAPR